MIPLHPALCQQPEAPGSKRAAGRFWVVKRRRVWYTRRESRKGGDGMRFTKMEGAGNDYIYINGFEDQVDDPAARFRSNGVRRTGTYI